MTKDVEMQKENKMGSMKIPKLLFSISVPIIISMLVQALYNIVDSIFVARFDPVAGTGALTLAFPIQMLMIAVATGFGIGMNALLSRALGQKDKEKSDLAAGQGVFLTACYVLKFFFPQQFVMAIENPTLISIGQYIDGHQWLFYLFGIFTSFISYWFYLCAVCKRWYLNWWQCWECHIQSC